MKPRTILSVFAVFIAVFSCSLIGYILGVNAAFEGNPPKQTVQSTVKGIPVKTEIPDSDDIGNSSKKISSPRYILRESDGKVALFIKNTDGTEKFHSSYDVPIMFLPKSDRDSLKKGIEFNSIDEIIKFAEDYVG